jgi:hypothetical protein
VYVDAEAGDRFEVLGDGPVESSVRVCVNSDGRLSWPEEVALSCCACGWSGDRFIEWEDDTSASAGSA